MPKYRKKPIVVEAFQLTKTARNKVVEWPEWLLEARRRDRDTEGSLWGERGPNNTVVLYLVTLEGKLEVSTDDWIIQGVKGELYPCKPGIFEGTHEAVEETTERAKRCMRGGCQDRAQGTLPFCSKRCDDLFHGRTD